VLVVSVILLVFIGRCLTQWLVPAQLKLTVWGSHIRLDGLLLGALLAYYHHFQRSALASFVRRWRWSLVVGAALLLTTPFLADATGMFTRTVGFSFIYLGYAAVMLLMVHGTELRAWPWRAIAFVGQHSYGIYLWHLPIGEWFHEPFVAGWAPGPGSLALYLVFALAGGIALSRLIEVPFLHLRDRYFPARSSAPV
jgi:peptidoglycan/LPS O-acetylase OafA/YrhL